MTNRISQIKPRELVRILEKTVIPLHAKDVKRGLLFGILKQANISQKDFLKALKEL